MADVAKQELWLTEFVGSPGNGAGGSIAEKAATWEESEERKDKLLGDMRDKLDDQKGEIIRLMDVEFVTAKGDTIRMKDVNRNANKEFDLGHHLKLLMIPDYNSNDVQSGKLKLTDKQKKQIENIDKNVKLVLEAQSKVVGLVTKMQEAPADLKCDFDLPPWEVEKLPETAKDKWKEQFKQLSDDEKKKWKLLEQRGTRESGRDPRTKGLKSADGFLFTDRELIDEFYSPLVREGIIPENAVAKPYSEFQAGFDAASDLYNEKCAEIKESDVYKRRAELLTKLGKAFISGAASGVGAIGHAANAGEALVHTTAVIKLVTDASAAVILGVISGVKSGADDIVDNIGNILSAIICQVDPTLGADVYNIYTAVTKTAMATYHLEEAIRNKDPNELQQMFQCLAVGFVDTFGELASKGDLTGTDKTTFSEFGTTLQSLFVSKVSAYDFAKALQKGDLNEIVKQVNEACKTATACIQAFNRAEGGKDYKEEKEKLYDEAIKEEQEKALDEKWKEEVRQNETDLTFADWKKEEEKNHEEVMQKLWKEEKEGLLAKDSTLTFEKWKEEQDKPEGLKNIADFDPDKFEKSPTGTFDANQFNEGVNETTELQEKFKNLVEASEGTKKKLVAGAHAKSREITNEKVSQERKRYRAMLDVGYDAADEEGTDGQEEILEEFMASQSIDDLIAQAQTDGLLLKMVSTLTQGGMVMVGQFVPACKAVAAGMVFLEKVIAASMRTLELLEWAENIEDAQVASSPVHAALLNHAHEMKKQITRDVILAILALAECAGASAACSGMDAGAGTAVQKTAAALAAGTEVAYEGITEAELERAWRTYKKALRNPDDRIQARKALERNPSLALYAVAYHAKAKEPIALNVMHQLGCNEGTIDSASPRKVVTFLEAKFNEDPKLYRAAVGTIKWLPKGGNPLSPMSWASARKKSGVDNTPSPGAVDGGMARVEKSGTAYKNAVKAEGTTPLDPEIVKAYSASLKELRAALYAYKPTKDGEPFKEMAEYLKSLVEHVDDAMDEPENKLRLFELVQDAG